MSKKDEVLTIEEALSTVEKPKEQPQPKEPEIIYHVSN